MELEGKITRSIVPITWIILYQFNYHIIYCTTFIFEFIFHRKCSHLLHQLHSHKTIVEFGSIFMSLHSPLIMPFLLGKF